MKSGSKIGMSLTFAWLCLCALLIGCPAEVVSPTDSGMATDSGDVADAGKDIQIKEAGDGGYDFNMWPPAGGTINYHGGPVMTNPVHVYLLWYGNWNNNTTVPIVEDFVIGLNKSPYFRITSGYYELLPITSTNPTAGPKGIAYATDTLIFVKSIFVGYTHGTSLSDENIFSIVGEVAHTGDVLIDQGALYLVLTSSDVQEGSGFGGFCGGYCGWHDHNDYNGYDLKFAFIGDPASCLDTCTAKTKYDEYGIAHSPNFNWSADGMVSVIGHEITEALTDPDWNTGPAWTDSNGYENADRCAWNYGDKLYMTSNGSVANVKLGTRDYLIQRNWALMPDSGQGCAMQP